MIEAGDYAAWHTLPGKVILTHIDGAPLTVSVSADGRTASNRRLGGGDGSSIMIDAQCWRTWESLGQWSLLIASTEHAAHFTNWQLAPDNWHPH